METEKFYELVEKIYEVICALNETFTTIQAMQSMKSKDVLALLRNVNEDLVSLTEDTGIMMIYESDSEYMDEIINTTVLKNKYPGLHVDDAKISNIIAQKIDKFNSVSSTVIKSMDDILLIVSHCMNAMTQLTQGNTEEYSKEYNTASKISKDIHRFAIDLNLALCDDIITTVVKDGISVPDSAITEFIEMSSESKKTTISKKNIYDLSREVTKLVNDTRYAISSIERIDDMGGEDENEARMLSLAASSNITVLARRNERLSHELHYLDMNFRAVLVIHLKDSTDFILGETSINTAEHSAIIKDLMDNIKSLIIMKEVYNMALIEILLSTSLREK